MTTRARFRVETVTRVMGQNADKSAAVELWHVSLVPVNDLTPGSDNAAVWPATPAGTIQITAALPQPDSFPLGADIFVDFTPAPKASLS